MATSIGPQDRLGAELDRHSGLQHFFLKGPGRSIEGLGVGGWANPRQTFFTGKHDDDTFRLVPDCAKS